MKRHGIAVNATFIIGSPEETKEEIMDTYNFIKDNKIDNASTYLLTPLPGTPVWAYAKQKGLVSDDMDWDVLHFELLSDSDDAIVLSEKVDKDDLIIFLKKFRKLERYFLIRQALKNPLSRQNRNFVIKKLREFMHKLF